MIPAGVVERLDSEDETVFVSMHKDQIKDAPDYDPDRHRADEAGYRDDVGQYYGPAALPPRAVASPR